MGVEDYNDGGTEVEICECEDGIDENGHIMVTMTCMKRLRKKKWLQDSGWNEDDGEGILDGNEVLQEELQDVSKPMVLVGTDVINLYPSLDIREVVKNVKEAILDSKIKWQEIDYLEGARYIALNWTEGRCRTSGLWRILPRRRYRGGTRPGLKGVGPQGGSRGDQEQWLFPHVRLRPSERKLLIATLVEIATESMFHHHFYNFGGKQFQQMERDR